MRQLCYTIEPEQDGMTVNAFARNIAGMSMRFLRTVKFRPQGIVVNGSRVTTRAVLRAGDHLVFTMEDEENRQVVPTEGPVRILFENADLVLVDKAAGTVVHPCHGHYEDTLLNHLLWYYRSREESVLLRPVGRLDKDTSGLIFIARNKYASRYMEIERTEGRLSRYYLALAEGWFGETGERGIIDRPIEKVPDVFNCYRVGEGGRPSVTHYEVLGHLEKEGIRFSVVRLKLETGRTHQIRVHMASCGHALLGDPIYGQEKLLGFERAALHSMEIRCRLPGDETITRFVADLPEDFQVCMNSELWYDNKRYMSKLSEQYVIKQGGIIHGNTT